jgi:hypothetical protein
MRTLSDEDKNVVELYFLNTILEMQEGLPKYILEDILEYYEEQEIYLACAGIKKVLDWYQTNTFTKVLLKIEEIKENNKLN